MSAAVVAGLRCWAQGVPADEAAVELLTSCLPARFAEQGCSWVCRVAGPGGGGWTRTHWPGMADEARVLALVITLLADRPAAVMAARSDVGRAA